MRMTGSPGHKPMLMTIPGLISRSSVSAMPAISAKETGSIRDTIGVSAMVLPSSAAAISPAGFTPRPP